MALTFHPMPGTIVICDFGTGFRPPEMVKVRPVVEISPRRRGGQLVTVIPLSSTEPMPAQPWHHLIAADAYPLARGPMWAKCDTIQTVALGRLDRVKTKDAAGIRTYITPQVSGAELAAIRLAVIAAQGIA